MVAALSVSSRAQAVYGSVFGTVTDPQGARVVGAVVTATDLTKNVTTSAQTNESGNYTMTHLSPGKYSVKVEHQGYKIIIQEVEVRADVAARTDFSLEIGTLTGQVHLRRRTPLLSEDGASLTRLDHQVLRLTMPPTKPWRATTHPRLQANVFQPNCASETRSYKRWLIQRRISNDRISQRRELVYMVNYDSVGRQTQMAGGSDCQLSSDLLNPSRRRD